MNRDTKESLRQLCASDGCLRPAERDNRYCESCAIEWALYRRESRERILMPSPRPVG